MKQLTWQLVRGKAGWKPNSWGSPIIGYFGAGYYSHIDWVTTMGSLRGARSDSVGGAPPGYQDRIQGYEPWAKQTRYTIDVPDWQYWRYLEFSDEQLGKPYDSHGLVETFVLGRDWRQDDSWWCSEEVAANWEYAEIIPAFPNYLMRVTPGDCAFTLCGMRALRKELV